VIIGGTAVTLGWDAHHATSDVDVWNDPGPEFWAAVAACRQVEGAVPVSKVSVASPPLNFEDRLIQGVVPGLVHLQVWVPEAHDLAMMKVVRGEAHNLDAIEDMHRISPLSPAVLLERYRETLSTHICPETRLKVHFLAMIARLFGDRRAESLEADL
jgi:hypothetical protein